MEQLIIAMVEARQTVGERHPQKDWNWKQTLSRGGSLLMSKREAQRELTPRLLFLEGVNRLLRTTDSKDFDLQEEIHYHWSLKIVTIYWEESP